MTLRYAALDALKVCDSDAKIQAVMALDANESLDCLAQFEEPLELPGRPTRPELVAPAQLKHRSVGSQDGHASLIHALAHIELNAVNLALDIVWRFPRLPPEFYRQWIVVAKEEAYHFSLLRTHLEQLNSQYGAFPAHNGLWEMVERTKGDVVARLALVPRTLEARGLDASPAIRDKLVSIGDKAGAEILSIILRDEIGHVAVGNHWYKHFCGLRGLNPIKAYADFAARYDAPKLRGPFNLEARRAAGFSDEELAFLLSDET